MSTYEKPISLNKDDGAKAGNYFRALSADLSLVDAGDVPASSESIVLPLKCEGDFIVIIKLL